MSDDIVTRLRAWSDNAKEQDATEIVVGLCQAADEIERLRNDLDGSQLAYRGASYDRDRMRNEIERLRKERDDARQLINAAADVIERLRKERDEARQLYCERLLEISRQQDCNAKWFADEMGWDCYKEEP